MARLRAAIRRARWFEFNGDEWLCVREIALDPIRHIVKKGEKIVHLVPKEFTVLQYLTAHAGRVIPHGQLLSSVWDPEYGREV